MLAAICTTKLPKQVVAAYAAPYPDFRYLTGNRQFTQMLPTRYDNPMLVDNFRARQKLASFDKPFLCLFSDKDIVAPNGHQSVRPFIKSAARNCDFKRRQSFFGRGCAARLWRGLAAVFARNRLRL
jgi:hypothetical protein